MPSTRNKVILTEIVIQISFILHNAIGKRKYIKFVYDKERKLLLFTGKFDKREELAKDFETGLDISGKYVTRCSFECHDVTNEPLNSQTGQQSSIWERGTTDARTILYYLSKNKKVLEVIRNGQPGSKTTTYQINPPLD